MTQLTMQQLYYDEYRHTAEAGFTEDQRTLLNDLARHGRSSKGELISRLGWGDRKVRKTAEMLKRLGIPVMASSGNGKGYWLSTDIDEINHYIGHELESRLASLNQQQMALSATLARLLPKVAP